MISRTTVKLKTLKGKHITVDTKRYKAVKVKKLKKLPKGTIFLIPSKDNPGGSKVAKRKPGRPRKSGRPKGSKTKKGRKGLPPRIKTGKRKGQFRKRKGKKRKKKKRGNPNNCL